MRPQNMPALVDTLIYIIACVIIWLTSVIPIKCLAWAGRQIGHITWYLDRRHRKVAIDNISAAYPKMKPLEAKDLAKLHFQRLGETYACILKTGGMNAKQIKKVLTVEGYERIEEI